MDPLIEQAQVSSAPKWIADAVAVLKPHISHATTFVPAWTEVELYGPASDARMKIHMHNSASMKTLSTLTDGRYNPDEDRTRRFSDGESTVRYVYGAHYVLVENGIKKDGFDKIEHTLYVTDETLFRKLRETVGLK